MEDHYLKSKEGKECTMPKLNIEEIEAILPHRYPFLLLDSVEYAVAKKCVTANEPFFQGHFPNYKVMPGVLIVEALAQTGAIALLSLPEYKGKIALFGGIKNCKFKTPVRPGDVLELSCRLTNRKGPVGIGEAEAKINGKIAVKAELSFAIQ